MQRDERGDSVSPDAMGERRPGEQRRVRPRDVGDDEEAEETRRDRQRRCRDNEPAGTDREQRKSVERSLHGPREPPLPACDGLGRGKTQAGREPNRGQREGREAERLVPLIEIEGRCRDEHGEGQRRVEPVEDDDGRTPARRGQSSAAALLIMRSTLRDTRGKPEFMPNSSRSIRVWASNSSRPLPPASRVTATSTISGFVTPSSVSSPVTRTAWSLSFWTEVETKSIDGCFPASRKAGERR